MTKDCSRYRGQAILNLWQKLKGFLGCCPKHQDCQWDEVDLRLAGLHIHMKRKSTLDIPHEVSVFVPRAEIRKTCPQAAECSCKGCPECNEEAILNSITIVHSPLHPLAGKAQNPPQIPARIKEYSKAEAAKTDIKIK